MNPWVTMWSQPRSTIRTLIHAKLKSGIFYLAYIFALQLFFFCANTWSFGIKFSVSAIFVTSLILAVPVGFALVYLCGWILAWIGRFLKGHAPTSHLVLVFAWSKIPNVINLFMWLILIFVDTDQAFIQDGGGTSSLFILLITSILGLWSFILLVQGIREVQGFSIARAISNILISWVVYLAITICGFTFVRYLFT